MAAASPLPHRFFERLGWPLPALLWAFLAASAFAQYMTAIVPGAPKSHPSVPPEEAPAPLGAGGIPPSGCCPPTPGQPPASQGPPPNPQLQPNQPWDANNPEGYGPEGNAIPHYSTGQGPEDEAAGNAKKKPWLGSKGAVGQASQAPSVPAWAQPGRLPQSQQAQSWGPAPPLLNQAFATDLLSNLQAAEANPASQSTLCETGWFRLHIQSHVNPGAYLSLKNVPGPSLWTSAASGPTTDLFAKRLATPQESQQLLEGNLSLFSPNFVEIPRWAVQPGDTFVMPGYKDTQNGPHPGHIGVIDKGSGGQLDTVSTNVANRPGWERIPLSAVESWYARQQLYRGTPLEKHIRFFRYAGPWPDPQAP